MATYYVDATAAAGGNGTSGSPWRTFAQAVNGCSAGDTIRIKPGKYFEHVKLNNPAKHAGTTWMADNPANRPMLDGGWSIALQTGPATNPSMPKPPADSSEGALFGIDEDVPNVTVDGIVTQNSTGHGFAFNGHNGTLKNSVAYFVFENGLMVNPAGHGRVDGLTVKNCKFFKTSMKRLTGEQGTAAVLIRELHPPVLIQDCELGYGHGEGFDVDKPSTGTETQPIVIERVTSHDFNHVLIYINQAHYVVIRDCAFFYSSQGANIHGGDENDVNYNFRIKDENKDYAPASHMAIYNNLMVNGGGLFIISGVNEEGKPPRNTQTRDCYVGANIFVGGNWTRKEAMKVANDGGKRNDCLFENNIIDMTHAAVTNQLGNISGEADFYIRNNLWSHQPHTTWRGDNLIVANPQLTNPGASIVTSNYFTTAMDSWEKVTTTHNFNPDNYKLKSNSPAIGAGSTAGTVPTDPPTTPPPRARQLDRVGVGRGPVPDIGAYEYNGVTPPAPAVTAAFSQNPPATTILVGTLVNFTNESVVTNTTITGYTWTVKKGSTTMHTATTANLTYTFASTGAWTVSLLVNTEAGVSDTETVTLTVNEPSGTPSATAAFSRNPTATTIDQGTTVQFTNTSTFTNTTKTGQLWEVKTSPGGSLVTSATTNNFSYTFNTAGAFTVTLTVNTAAGVSDSESVTITVNAVVIPTVTAGFTASVGPVVDEGTSITFTNTSSATNTTITGYVWTISNGVTEIVYTTTDATYTFGQAGMWTVTLVANSAAGISDSANMSIVVQVVSSGGSGLYRAMVVPHRVALNTSTGEQTITTTALGTLVPKGATIRLTAAVTDATAANGALWSEGATDGAAQWALSRFSQDGAAGGAAKRRYKSGRLLQTIDQTGAVTGEAVLARFVAGGLVLNITDAFPAGYLAEIDFYAGDEMRVAAGTALLGAVDSPVAVLTGINQDAVYVASTFAPDGQSAATIDADLSRGWALKNGAQLYFRNQDRGDVATTALNTRHGAARVGMSGDGTPGVNVFLEAGGFTTTGFTLTARINSLNSLPVGWFAFALGGPRLSLTTATLATSSPSSHAISFEAQTVLALTATTTTEDAAVTDTFAEGLGYYATSIYNANAEYMTWIAAEDGAATTDTKSWSDNAFRAIDHDGTNKFAGAGALDTNSLDITWSAAPASGYKMILLAIEKAAALPDDPPEDPPPTVEFTADVRSGLTKLLVQFDSSLVNDNGSPITAYLWNFGDGSTSTGANPRHIYTTAGSFTVSLTVTNANGSSTKTVEDYIVAANPSKRRTLVGPIRSRSITSTSDNNVDLDWPDIENRSSTSNFGFHSHAHDSVNVLRLRPATTAGIAALAGNPDGQHAMVLWNYQTQEITVIETDGTIRKVATTT